MSIDEEFQAAVSRVAGLRGLGNDALLELYGLYKQATSGDAVGSRPGMLDVKGRAKFDAWSGRRGMSKDDAKREYAKFVGTLK